MNNFIFHNPTRLIFGKDTIGKIGNELNTAGIKKVLMLYGKGSIHKNGVYDKVLQSLNEQNIEVTEIGGIKPNPVLSKVDEAIKAGREAQVDAVLGVGGGSVIDTAKAVAAGILYQGDIWDAFEGRVAVNDSLPIYAVLTLSATGSEMNGFAVITKEEECKKWAFSAGIKSYPVVSILDPSVQTGLPAEQTVNGAIDALSHIFEVYFDGALNNASDEMAEGLIRNIIKHTRVLLNNPENYDSRAELAWSATIALNGILGAGRNYGDWSSHTLEHSLSAFFDVSHGKGLSIVFPAWMKYVHKNDLNKFSRFAGKVFGIIDGSEEDRALNAITELESFFSESGAPIRLKEIGVRRDDLPLLAGNAAIKAPFGRIMELHYEDILNIYNIAFE